MEENQNLNDNWEEVKGESNLWLPSNPGEAIEGVIVSMEKKQFGIQTIIETKDQKQIALPSHKVLQNRLSNCKVGELIKVIFEKEELPKVRGQNPMKVYKVLTKKL